MNVAVIGDVMLDKYNEVTSRPNPENTAPAYTIEDVSHQLGGAGNTAMMLAQFGVKVKLFGCVGHDDNAEIIRGLLLRAEIPNLLLNSITPTIVKERFRNGDKYLFRVDTDCGYVLIDADERAFIQSIKQGNFDAIVVSDYAKETLSKELVAKLKELKIPMFVDTKPKNIDWYKSCFMIKPNRKEFIEIANSYNYNNVNNLFESIKSASSDIASKLDTLLLITMGQNGIVYSDGRNFSEIEGIKVNCVDVTGAGDVTMAAFVAKYLETKKLDVAANFANEMAAKSVTQKQTGLCL